MHDFGLKNKMRKLVIKIHVVQNVDILNIARKFDNIDDENKFLS